MHIILINHYAGSPEYGMEFRPYYLAREWARQGHRVLIIASSYSHLRRHNPQMARSYQFETTADGVEYLWIRTKPYTGNGAARLVNMLQFTLKLYQLSSMLAAQRPDAVIASSTYPYDAIPARSIARKANASLVFEIHDLWPLTPQLLGNFSKWHPMIVSMQWAENYAYRHAEKVVSILPGTESHAIAHGLAPGKFIHIPNGISPQDTEAAPPEEMLDRITKFARAFRIVGMYAGGHAVSNALEPLIAAMAHPDSANVGMILVGSGSQKAKLQALVQKQGLKNVLFLDPVTKNAVPALLRQAHFAYIGWQDSPLYLHGVSPNKLFDYMLAGVPIVHSTNSPYDLVRDARCGLSVPANDPGAIAQALRAMALMPAEERETLGLAGKAYVQEHHLYPALARQFLAAMTP